MFYLVDMSKDGLVVNLYCVVRLQDRAIISTFLEHPLASDFIAKSGLGNSATIIMSKLAISANNIAAICDKMGLRLARSDNHTGYITTDSRNIMRDAIFTSS